MASGTLSLYPVATSSPLPTSSPFSSLQLVAKEKVDPYVDEEMQRLKEQWTAAHIEATPTAAAAAPAPVVAPQPPPAGARERDAELAARQAQLTAQERALSDLQVTLDKVALLLTG